MEGERVVVEPVRKPFLQYKGAIFVGEGDIENDIEKAKTEIAENHNGDSVFPHTGLYL
jgi:hypothetical protein